MIGTGRKKELVIPDTTDILSNSPKPRISPTFRVRYLVSPSSVKSSDITSHKDAIL